MSTIKDFEDLEIWQMAREQGLRIYILLRKVSFEKEFEIKNQMKKSCGSVMDNIAEGFERGGNAEFINFLGISKGSNGELRSQLHRAFDNDFITKEEFDLNFEKNQIIGKKINSFINYLKNSNIKGFKFHK
jgi:four helix bundle protein